jgi:hypothetical protein
VLGYVDGLLILPFGSMLVVWLVPPRIVAGPRAAAERAGQLPVGWAAAAVMVALWITILALVLRSTLASL